MKKQIRLALYILLSCSAFYASIRIYYTVTDGFNPRDLASEFAYRENLTIPVASSEQIEKINPLLQQKFSYLGKGVQAYALVSEDQRYVIKIGKQKLYRFNILDKALFQLPYTENLKKAKTLKLSKRLQRFLSGYLIGYQELPEESRLLYLHLLPTDNVHPKILIADKLGFTYEVDLNKVEFIVQEKAETTEAKIRSFVEKKDYVGAKKTLQTLVDLFVACTKKGIIDTDTGLQGIFANTGFINDEAMFIDTGRFVKDENIKNDPAFYQEYMSTCIESLQKRTQTYFPELGDLQLVVPEQG